MQQEGLTCRRRPRYVHTTDANHGEPVYANLMKGLSIESLNQCWVADLTFVRLPEGFVYLACILDAYSRKCIGWSLARKMESSLPLHALEMALAERQVTPGLIYHSDRGRQYCSFAYVNRLRGAGIQISTSAPGQPTQNARAESFFKTLKCEEVYVITIRRSRRHKRTYRRFLRMCTMRNAFTHLWTMSFLMSLKRIISSVNVVVVWISWGIPSLGVLPIRHHREIGYQNNERLIVCHLYWCDTKTESEKAVSYARVSYSLGRFPFTSYTPISSVFSMRVESHQEY